jgi:hypothetical protein
MKPLSAAVVGSFSALAIRGVLTLGLLVCLFSGVALADDGDDTLRMYLSKSDVVLLGEFTADPLAGAIKELGVIHYQAEFKISQLLKGESLGERRVGGTIKVNIVRFEQEPEDRLPELKQGGNCILFLKCNDRQATPSYITSDVWFGVQRPSPWMATSLSRLAAEQAKKAR